MAKPQTLVVISTTEKNLADAFDEWLRQYKEDPDSFGDYDSDEDTSTYGEDCAEKLISVLKDLNATTVSEVKA